MVLWWLRFCFLNRVCSSFCLRLDWAKYFSCVLLSGEWVHLGAYEAIVFSYVYFRIDSKLFLQGFRQFLVYQAYGYFSRTYSDTCAFLYNQRCFRQEPWFYKYSNIFYFSNNRIHYWGIFIQVISFLQISVLCLYFHLPYGTFIYRFHFPDSPYTTFPWPCHKHLWYKKITSATVLSLLLQMLLYYFKLAIIIDININNFF